MTREEKRDAIRAFCVRFGLCSSVGKTPCPLRGIEGFCYMSGADIDRNYDILVHAGLIAPDDESKIENNEYKRIWDRKDPVEKAYDELYSSPLYASTQSFTEAEQVFAGASHKLSTAMRDIVDEMNNNAVQHPAHYTKGGIECIQAIKASMTPGGFCDYCKGNVIKYLWRWRDKGGAQDLEKAKVYLDWLIEAAKGEK